MKSKAAKTVVSVMLLSSMAVAGPLESHPNADALNQLFGAPLPADFKLTGVTRADYLKLIAGNVDFFKSCQNADGAIIDPVSHGERQYSTPAFAAAAGVLVKEAGRRDLLEPASKALTCALTALVQKRPADKHADFYAPLLVHAYRFLKDVADPQQSAAWAEQFKQIDPTTMYRADLRGMNWNIVSSSGELLRRHDDLVASAQRDAQMSYLETCLKGHLKTLTKVGLFEDPGAPMAYDAFSRLWLEDAFADDAYTGQYRDQISDFLRTGGFSTLLMLSPTGEWPTGGRSALHNWTDAEAAAICEMNAAYWQRSGRSDIAATFKRAAHLAFQSVARWQRPSGELWIIKNRAEPETRFAYEGYSNHSQYNLLPMAMLAIAYSRADESIAERPTPAEAGSYVFDARDIFHKIFAAAGGYYAEIDTAGDPHYNATGLQRVHRAGVISPALTDTAASDRAYQPANAPKKALALGVSWPNPNKPGENLSLAEFVGEHSPRLTAKADLTVSQAKPGEVAFTIKYNLTEAGKSAGVVTEDYSLSADGVRQTSRVAGQSKLTLRVPVLVTDGAADTQANVSGTNVSITQHGSATNISVQQGDLKLIGDRLVTHSGWVQAAEATGGDSMTATITLKQN